MTMEKRNGAEDCKENYSYQQKQFVIPICKNKMNSAVLEAPLVSSPNYAKLPHLRASSLSRTRCEADLGDSASDSCDTRSVTPSSMSPSLTNESAGEFRDCDAMQSVPNDITPHPPSSPRLKNFKGKRPNLMKSNAIEGVREIVTDSENDQVLCSTPSSSKGTDSTRFDFVKENDLQARKDSVADSKATQSASNAELKLEQSDVEDLIGRKLQEDSMLLNSYENYLRQLSKEEECEAASDSDSESFSSESSNSSFSVSSLSSNDDKDNTKTVNDNEADVKTFEPLYSLPIKPPKDKNSQNSSTNTKIMQYSSSTLVKDELNPELSKQSMYMSMNKDLLNTNGLRTQSAPDLRASLRTRTLDTCGYMCPNRLPKIEIKEATLSSPELMQTTFNPKYRPLPTIPIHKTSSRGDNTDETIYEKIATQRSITTQGSLTTQGSSMDSAKSKMSFKAVANRVVSLMPRLTTREARSREMDQYMADILRYLPDKKLRIFVGTWNMKGTKVIPDSLDDYLLPNESVFIQDIYAIGCQEGSPFRKEWEICLQETLGPTHVLMYSGNFGVLQLSIFVRRELVWFCTSIEQDTIATRIAHKIKTKGAMAVSFNVFGTSLLFINSHFASDQRKINERVQDYKAICRSLAIPFGDSGTSDSNADVTSRFDRVFWFGDFNFRVNRTRAETDLVFAERSFENRHERKEFILKELLPHDQLHALLRKGKIFHGFQESPIEFLPTYKFDVNTDTYDTSTKKRVPSWTDRILYKSRQPDQIKVAMYNSCTSIKHSDHRPVYAIIEANIEPVQKNVMLPSAMFDREIYVEANMRRSAPRGNQQSSNVCVIL